MELLEPFIASLNRAYTSFFPDGVDPLKSSDYSHIVSSQHFTRLSGLLSETNGKIVIGGQSDESSLKIAPTVVVLDTTSMGLKAVDDDSLMRGEIFGPILPVLVLEGGVQAATRFLATRCRIVISHIHYCNSHCSHRDHPLVLYAFTQDPSVKEHSRMIPSAWAILDC